MLEGMGKYAKNSGDFKNISKTWNSNTAQIALGVFLMR